MRVRSRRLAPLAATLVLAGGGLAGCGQRNENDSDSGCSGGGLVCTIDADGATTYDLDQLGTEVVIDELQPASVRVRIARDQATLRRGVPVRLHGFVLTATATSTDEAKIRVQR
jgi:hypothetical protein